MSTLEFKKTANAIKKNLLTWKCPPCTNEVSVRIQSDIDDDDEDFVCESAQDKLKPLINKLLQRFTNLENKFDNFRTSIENRLTSIQDEVNKISKQNSTLESTISVVDNKLEVHNSLNPEEIIRELNMRKKRESNVIILNATESKKGSGNDRLNDDKSLISTILPTELGNITEFKLKRLGKPSAGKNRPLLLETKSASIAKSILKSKPARDTDPPIRFKPDLTKAQQNHLNSLRSQLDSLNKSGVTDKTIKYINGVPKIVTHNFREIPRKGQNRIPSIILPKHQRLENQTEQLPRRLSN